MLGRRRASLSSGFLAIFLCGGLVAACSGSGGVNGIGADAATGGDASNGNDASTGGDATTGTDASTGGDATTGTDADTGHDGATGGDGSIDGGDDGGTHILDGGTDADADADANCTPTSTKVQQPLDIFIMLDQSASMDETVAGGGSKWAAVTGALQQFVNSQVEGVSVGIQYFGLMPGGAPACPATCTVDADCGPTGGPCVVGICTGCSSTGGDSCNAADYATPDVEIAPLPGNVTALVTSMGKHSPSTATPTSAALQGAVDHAKAWALAHPEHVVIALFATDGDPTECDTDLNNIDAIAATAAAGNPRISTFVIGVGSSLTALNGIAAAGGTQQAFIVDPTLPNLNQQFLGALNSVRLAASGCHYPIPAPASGPLDPSKIAMQVKAADGSTKILPKIANSTACPASGDAWYYDDNASPKHIVLCDATCKGIASSTGEEVDVLSGCDGVAH